MTEGIVAASSETSSAPDDCLAGEPKSASGERAFASGRGLLGKRAGQP